MKMGIFCNKKLIHKWGSQKMDQKGKLIVLSLKVLPNWWYI